MRCVRAVILYTVYADRATQLTFKKPHGTEIVDRRRTMTFSNHNFLKLINSALIIE